MTPFFDLIEELRALGGAPKVTYPTGNNNYPQTERTIKAKRGTQTLALGSAEPDTVRFPNNILTEQIELRADAQVVEVYRKYEVLPGPFTKQGQDYDPEYGFLAEYTEGEVKNGAAIGTAVSDIEPLNYIKSNLKTYTVPTAALNAFYLTFPASAELNLPKVLAAVLATWDIATGTGGSSETGSGSAVGSSGTVSVTLQNRSQGSASVLADLTPVFQPHPQGELPVLDYFFFLPNPVTLSAILARSSAIASALAGSSVTVNQWPVFMGQEHTFIITGQKASVSADASAHCMVSFIITPTNSSVSDGVGNGGGSSVDMGSNVKAVTIPESIHGDLYVQGFTSLFATANASASAVIAAETNFPGASSTPPPLSQEAWGSVTPNFIAATPVAALPTAGLYLYQPDVAPYKWGYSTVRARIFDFSVLTGSVSLGQPQITVADFNGLTGASFVKSAQQITTVNFTGLTGANFVTTLAQITTVDFTGLTGANYVTALPQITVVDFTSMLGSNFVTGSAGKGFTIPSASSGTVGVWFNTGTETQPTFSGATSYVQVSVSSSAVSTAIAAALATAFSASPIWTVTGAGALATFTSVALVAQTAAADVNTGASIYVSQAGSTNNPGLYLTMPSASSGVFAIWFNTGTEVQPTVGGAGTYLEVSLSPTATASAIASAVATALAGESSIWTVSASGAVATFTSVAKTAQSAAAAATSGAAVTITQAGSTNNPGKAFLLPSSSTFLGAFGVWFDTGTESAPAITGALTYIQVSISPTATASAIASALAAAFSGQTALWSVSAVSATVTYTSVSYAAQGNAADVNSGAAITVTQEGGAATGLYFNIYGYQVRATAIWFNTGNEIAPVVLGSTIQVAISPTATASQIAAAVVAAVPAQVGAVWVMAQINGAGTNTAARFTAVSNQTTTNAADVSTGAAITTTQTGQPPTV